MPQTLFRTKNERKQSMKINRFPLRHFIAVLFLLARPAIVHAQFNYVTNSDGVSISIYGYTGPGGAVVVPNMINGYTVTIIENGTFYGVANLTSVILPTGITHIGVSTFEKCYSLTSVTIPGTVTGIGSNAFEYCYSLANITFPENLTSIGVDALFDCTNLSTVTIPGSVTNIGTGVFGNCTSLTNITVNAANPSYSSSNGVLFDEAQDTIVDYPAGRRGPYTIPNSVASIGKGLFQFCPNLTSVTIPANVTTIGTD